MESRLTVEELAGIRGLAGQQIKRNPFHHRIQPPFRFDESVTESCLLILRLVAEVERLTASEDFATDAAARLAYELADMQTRAEVAEKALAEKDESLKSQNHVISQIILPKLAEKDAEIADLKHGWKVATNQATTCARCGVFKHTPVRRDPDGYICAGCLEKEANESKDEIERLQAEAAAMREAMLYKCHLCKGGKAIKCPMPDTCKIHKALSSNAGKSILERLRAAEKVVEAARCIRHWHDTMYNEKTGETEGMVVSASHVRALWESLAAYDKAGEVK